MKALNYPHPHLYPSNKQSNPKQQQQLQQPSQRILWQLHESKLMNGQPDQPTSEQNRRNTISTQSPPQTEAPTPTPTPIPAHITLKPSKGLTGGYWTTNRINTNPHNPYRNASSKTARCTNASPTHSHLSPRAQPVPMQQLSLSPSLLPQPLGIHSYSSTPAQNLDFLDVHRPSATTTTPQEQYQTSTTSSKRFMLSSIFRPSESSAPTVPDFGKHCQWIEEGSLTKIGEVRQSVCLPPLPSPYPFTLNEK